MGEVKESDVDARKEEGLGTLATSEETEGAKPLSLEGRMTGPTRRSTKGGWTEEEDKILTLAVKKFGGKNWKKIAKCVPDRTDVQCLHRWQKVLNPNLVKGPWTKEEDDLITQLVGQHGNKKWAEIAKHLPGRIGKQCRERWHNHLNPEIKRTAWSKEEGSMLIKCHETYGNKWAEIAKFLPGRTENSIKNYWNCSVSKKLELSLTHGYDLHKMKAKRRNSEVQNQRVERERGPLTFSPDLVLGNPERRESLLLSSDGKDYRVSGQRAIDIIKPPNRAVSDESGVATHGLTIGQCQGSADTAHTSRDLNHISAYRPNESCTNSFGDFSKSMYLQEMSHEHESHSLPSRMVSSPVTPPSHNERISVSCQSPGSILKSLARLARTFKAPSIIKRFPTARKTGNENETENEEPSLPKEKLDKSRSSCQSSHQPTCRNDDVNSTALSNAKELFLSPPKSQKLETSAGILPVEKRLEYAFDDERNSTRDTAAADSFVI